jgi:hypothetical protein
MGGRVIDGDGCHRYTWRFHGKVSGSGGKWTNQRMLYLGFRCEGQGTALHTYDVGGDWEWGSVMEV